MNLGATFISVPEWHWAQQATYSQGVRYGDLVLTHGVAAFDNWGAIVGLGDIDTQIRQVVANLDRLLTVAGGSLACIIRQQVFLRRPEHIRVFSRLRSELYTAPFPVSIMVAVSALAHPDMLVEVACEAVLPSATGVAPVRPAS